MTTSLNNPKAIAEAGERIYSAKFRAEFEPTYKGQYAVINVGKETAFRGETPEEAFNSARADDARGIFHLVRIGFSGAFTISYQYRNGAQDWLFG